MQRRALVATFLGALATGVLSLFLQEAFKIVPSPFWSNPIFVSSVFVLFVGLMSLIISDARKRNPHVDAIYQEPARRTFLNKTLIGSPARVATASTLALVLLFSVYHQLQKTVNLHLAFFLVPLAINFFREFYTMQLSRSELTRNLDVHLLNLLHQYINLAWGAHTSATTCNVRCIIKLENEDGDLQPHRTVNMARDRESAFVHVPTKGLSGYALSAPADRLPVFTKSQAHLYHGFTQDELATIRDDVKMGSATVLYDFENNPIGTLAVDFNCLVNGEELKTLAQVTRNFVRDFAAPLNAAINLYPE